MLTCTWCLAVLMLVAWFYATVMHELSHALVAYLRGAKVKIYPYWHRYQGQFYFGRYTWEGGRHGPRVTEHAAPLLFDAATAVVALVLAVLFSWHWTVVFSIACLIDASVWVCGYFWGGPDTDGQKFREEVENGS